jgi:hypothetical protein
MKNIIRGPDVSPHHMERTAGNRIDLAASKAGEPATLKGHMLVHVQAATVQFLISVSSFLIY